MDEKLRFEIDRAAWRNARKDAVKLDFKAYFNGLKVARDGFFSSNSSFSSAKLPKSSASTAISSVERGWSGSNVPGGEDTGSRERRFGCAFRLRSGVRGESSEDSASVLNDSMSDGMDSKDTVRVERTDPNVLSHTDRSSSSRSSGGVNSRSNGPLPNVKLSSFSDSWDLSIMDSTVIRFSAAFLEPRRLRDLGGGILVTARSAATDAGMASGLCTSFERCDDGCRPRPP